MMLKKIILLSILILTSACNLQNTKTEAEADMSLEELISLRKNAEDAYQQGEWEMAIGFYTELTQKVEKDSQSWFKLGNAHARLNHSGAALQAYQKALSLDQNNSKIWHNMGIVQLKLATNTFVEMQRHTTANDPLSIRANLVVNAISDLLQHDFSIETKE
jgi:tetratricopeptide (TPR) repeat protein